MKPLTCLAASLVCSMVLIATADAQPILERIEGFVRDQIDAVKTPASAEAGYLGMIGDDSQEDGRGVRVIEVYPDHAAAQAGLRAGDLIKKIDDRPIRSMDSLGAALTGKPVGARLAMTVEREGADQLVNVTLGKRAQTLQPAEILPAPAPQNITPAGPAPAKLGVRTVPVTDEVRRHHNLTDAEGGHVISVAVGSPAERAGIPLGAVITAIDGRPVRTPQDLATLVREAQKPAVEVTYVFGGETTQKMVQVTSVPPAEEGPQLEVRARPPQPNLVAPAPVPDLAGNGVRLEALERRIAELEARIKALEEASGKPAPVPPQSARPEPAPPEPALIEPAPEK